MDLQMQLTSNAVYDRFFSPDRVDGALQRAYLANVLRFYSARAQRYGLLEPDAAAAFQSYLSQFEKAGLDFRPTFEGFIVSLEDPGRRPVVQDNLTVHVLTAGDFDAADADLTAAIESSVTEPSMASSAPLRVHDDDPVDAGNESTEASTPETVDIEVAHEEGTESPHDESEHIELPQEVDVVLGESLSGEVVWRPSVKGSPHLFITGISGQGKSYTVLRLLMELSRQDVPALVFDFHGQLGDDDGPYARQATPNVIDAAAGLPFSPFDCTIDNSASGWNSTAMAVAEIFGYVCGLGDIQRDVLFTCIRDAYRSYGFGTNSADGPAAGEFPTLQDVLRRIELAERDKRSQNLLARCRPLLEMDVFRPEAGTAATLLDAVRHGMVIDLHALASETLQLAASAFVLRKVYRDMFSWGLADRLHLVVVLDEAHRLARDVTLPKLMKEGRKYGVAAVIASQGLADFHPDVLGNAGTKIAFRANYPESRRIAGFFRARAGTDLVAIVEGLGVGAALIQTPEMPMASRVRMRPPDE